MGDCWLLSAISIVSERYDLMHRIFYDTINVDSKNRIYANTNTNTNARATLKNWSIPKSGKIAINLCVNGKWEPITIDTCLPVTKISSKSKIPTAHNINK